MFSLNNCYINLYKKVYVFKLTSDRGELRKKTPCIDPKESWESGREMMMIHTHTRAEPWVKIINTFSKYIYK